MIEQDDMASQAYADPNLTYFESLTESEKRTFNDLMYGKPGAESTRTPCVEQADAAAYSDQGLREELMSALRNDLDEIDRRIDADERVVQYELSLAACVDSHGLEFVDIESTYNTISTQIESISAMLPGSPISHVGESEMVNMDADELTALMEKTRSQASQELPQDVLDDLSIIQAAEIELAMAVERCGGLRVLSDLRNVVRAELESAYLAENQGALVAVAEQRSEEG